MPRMDTDLIFQYWMNSKAFSYLLWKQVTLKSIFLLNYVISLCIIVMHWVIQIKIIVYSYFKIVKNWDRNYDSIRIILTSLFKICIGL